MTDNIILKSGKEIYANRGLVSCIKTDKGWELCEGYDGEIFLNDYQEKSDDYGPVYTQNELLELAELMIQRWIDFKVDVYTRKVPIR